MRKGIEKLKFLPVFHPFLKISRKDGISKKDNQNTSIFSVFIFRLKNLNSISILILRKKNYMVIDKKNQ